jgi:hypothetical protein
MVNLLIDRWAWIKLAKRADGQRLIVPSRVFVDDGLVDLLVP